LSLEPTARDQVDVDSYDVFLGTRLPKGNNSLPAVLATSSSYANGHEELHIALEGLLAALGVPLYPD